MRLSWQAGVAALGAGLWRAWQELVRPLILLDVACHRQVMKIMRPQHVLLGQCHKRGMCCRHIVADVPALMRRHLWIMRLFLAYHARVHRFMQVSTTADGSPVFRCGHLRASGACGIYRLRPRLCRMYPVMPLFGPPGLLPGCGYRTAHRQVAAMRPRASLPVLNAHVAQHHPGPDPGQAQPAVEQVHDYHLVDPIGGRAGEADA